MELIKIAIGSDHRGFDLKNYIIEELSNQFIFIDVGTYSKERTDYSIYAKKVIKLIQDNQLFYGILICASGVGMSIIANRYKNIYASLCWSSTIAKLSKEEDNSNILVFPSDFISYLEVINSINIWFNSNFKGGIYKKRLLEIDYD